MCVTRKPKWLDSGLQLISEEGEGGLTVDALCTRMQRTKGAFYHHFPNRDAYVTQLLEHWEQTYTGRIIEELEAVPDAVARLRALGERTARDVDLRLERRIRVWSDREPAARAVLERVDQARESYLRDQFGQALGDPHRAQLAARAHMAFLVGTEMLYQDLPRQELRELSHFVDRVGFQAPPRAHPPAADSNPPEEKR